MSNLFLILSFYLVTVQAILSNTAAKSNEQTSPEIAAGNNNNLYLWKYRDSLGLQQFNRQMARYRSLEAVISELSRQADQIFSEALANPTYQVMAGIKVSQPEKAVTDIRDFARAIKEKQNKMMNQQQKEKVEARQHWSYNFGPGGK